MNLVLYIMRNPKLWDDVEALESFLKEKSLTTYERRTIGQRLFELVEKV